MSGFFQKRTGGNTAAADKVAVQRHMALRENIAELLQPEDDNTIGYAIGTESFNEAKDRDLQSMFDRVKNKLTAVGLEIGLESNALNGIAQVNAAASAAVTVGNSASMLKTNMMRTFEVPRHAAGYDKGSNAYTTVVGMEGMADAFANRSFGLENFDDRDNRNARVTSVSYNLNAAQQNEFGETFFPTVTISNDMVGVAVSIRLISVIKDFTRNADASLADFRRRNVVRALLDHTILKNDTNKLVPQYKAQTAQWFSSDIGSFTKEVEGVTHTTGALKINTHIGDLIALGYPESTNGHSLNQGDTLDPAVYLSGLYVKLGNNKLRLSLKNFKRNGFLAAPEDDSRQQNLNMNINTLFVQASTLQFNQAALVAPLDELVTQKWTLQLGLGLTGNLSASQGDIRVDCTDLRVVAILDEDGAAVDLTGAAAKAIVDLVSKAAVVGYDIDARTSNLNRRQRGQIMDTTVYNQVWTVPLRSPITYPRPVNATSETDAADLAVLVSTTHARTSNEAVTTLFETADMMSEYAATQSNDLDSIPPERFGIARLLLKPTYKFKEVDLTTVIQNAKSSEKERDIAAESMLQIKNVVYEMYRDSGFQAFIESGAAGVTGNPTVLIGTDPYTSRFIFVQGDSRTLGPDFEFKIVTTPDERMQGNIVLAFGYPELFKGEINPAHFGNMLWAAETVLVLQMNRNGDAQKETTVQPRFRHIVNVPVMGWIVLRGIPEVVATRVPRAFQQLDASGNIVP
jgi:hypothetical protein